MPSYLLVMIVPWCDYGSFYFIDNELEVESLGRRQNGNPDLILKGCLFRPRSASLNIHCRFKVSPHVCKGMRVCVRAV